MMKNKHQVAWCPVRFRSFLPNGSRTMASQKSTKRQTKQILENGIFLNASAYSDQNHRMNFDYGGSKRPRRQIWNQQQQNSVRVRWESVWSQVVAAMVGWTQPSAQARKPNQHEIASK
jgi:hypothetical protein